MNIGAGIAFAGLVAGAAYLEVSGKHAGGLWFIVVVWAIFGSWGCDNTKGDEK